jgi:hypothetical protein
MAEENKVIVDNQNPWNDDEQHIAVTVNFNEEPFKGKIHILELHPGTIAFLIKDQQSINYLRGKLLQAELSLKHFKV